MKRTIGLLAAVLVAGSAFADTEINMTSRDQSGNITGYTKIYVQGDTVRQDNILNGMEDDTTGIFTGDSFTMLFHYDKTYITFDENAYDVLKSIGDRERQRIDDYLARLPEDQQEKRRTELYAQWEEMYGDKLAGREFRPTGSDQWDGTPCSRFAIMQEGEMTREICVVPFHAVIEDESVVQALRDMATHITRSATLLPSEKGERVYVSAIGLINDVDGFPVITREVTRRRVESETELGWISETYVDPDMFKIPEDYSEVRLLRR